MIRGVRHAGWGLYAALALASAPALATDVVATVLGTEIGRAALAGEQDGNARARRLFELLWRPLARHYIEQNGLAATDEEVAEAAAYHREFARRDRLQRTRKLSEIKRRLAAANPDERERAWLEEFRAVLTRMERRDSERDREPPPEPGRLSGQLRPSIEAWKLNRALYERYGGVVALTWSGPDPHGARSAVVADYERRGLLAIADAALRQRLMEWLDARPSMVIPPESVDLTPYWRRPIPPSYFPD